MRISQKKFRRFKPQPRNFNILKWFISYHSEGLQIVINIGNAADAEVVDKHLRDVGREESRQGRAEVDVLHSEAQKGQQHYDGFLLVPRDVINNRQLALAVGGTMQLVVNRMGPLNDSNSSRCFHQALP